MSPCRTLLLLIAVGVTAHISASGARAEEIGVLKDRIRIGSSSNKTGVDPERSAEVRGGAELYFKKLNAAGGVNGRKIELIDYDDGFVADRAAENARRLIQVDKVFMLFQVYGAAGSTAILPIVEKSDVPLFAPVSGAIRLRRPVVPEVFNVKAGYPEEATTIVDYLVSRGIRDVAVFYEDDAFGTSGLASTLTALGHHGLSVRARGANRHNNLEVDEAVDAIRKSNAKAVVLWTQAKPGAIFVKRCVKAGFNPVFLGGSGQAAETFLREIHGTEAEVHISQGLPFFNDDSFALSREYRKDAETSGSKPSMAGMEGYLNARVAAEGLRRAGPLPTRESFEKALESMKQEDFGGIQVSFSPQNHQGISRAYLCKVTESGCQPETFVAPAQESRPAAAH